MAPCPICQEAGGFHTEGCGGFRLPESAIKNQLVIYDELTPDCKITLTYFDGDELVVKSRLHEVTYYWPTERSFWNSAPRPSWLGNLEIIGA